MPPGAFDDMRTVPAVQAVDYERDLSDLLKALDQLEAATIAGRSLHGDARRSMLEAAFDESGVGPAYIRMIQHSQRRSNALPAEKTVQQAAPAASAAPSPADIPLPPSPPVQTARLPSTPLAPPADATHFSPQSTPSRPFPSSIVTISTSGSSADRIDPSSEGEHK